MPILSNIDQVSFERTKYKSHKLDETVHQTKYIVLKFTSYLTLRQLRTKFIPIQITSKSKSYTMIELAESEINERVKEEIKRSQVSLVIHLSHGKFL